MRLAARCVACLAISLVLFLCMARPGQARLKYLTDEEASSRARQQMAKPTVEMPYTTLGVHNVGNFLLSVTNWGFFGSQNGEFIDPKTGLSAPGAEFPAGSKIDYLFQGALWISALIGNDTLTSVGHDGWQHIAEMYPETFENGGDIIERSTRPGSEFYSDSAVSEQDFIAVYTDTLTDPAFVSDDPFTGPHVPLYIKITQKSYSWSYSYAEDFVLLDFTLENIGFDSLRSLYMGLYIDADVYHFSRSMGFEDDICGFRQTMRHASGARVCGTGELLLDSINIAWIGDNDGDPVSGIFDYRSPKAVTGTRVVRSPTPAGGCGPTPLDYSFNWWISQGDTRYDWSPQHMPGDMNFSGGYGTPDGDAHKYRYMMNGEFDYDQVFAGIDYSDSTRDTDRGWIPPNKQADNLADGYDTRYLLSFGPFDIAPGEGLPVTVAYIAGNDFHNDPGNIGNLPAKPGRFYENLDFTDLAVNGVWAANVFDNPGTATPDPETGEINEDCRGLYYLVNCSDTVIGGELVCFDCDTIWYAGDGIPDYKGPPPPPSPVLEITTLPGKVIIEWDGSISELAEDPFSFFNDFEGYRVYMSDLNQVANFALIASWDKVDFRPYREDVTEPVGSAKRWKYREYPLTLEELREKFGDPEFDDPLQYPSPLNPYEAPDGQRYYFEAEDWNRGNEYPEKNYKNEIQRDTILSMEGDEPGDTLYYGHYHFEIEGLLPSQSYYFAVTTFDYGYPQNGLEPLESSPLANSQLTFPIYSATVVEDSNLNVSVYPNPYKITDDYRGHQYEDPYREGWSERDRRVHFVNLPAQATVKIFTLDGDLVRVIEHYEGGQFSDTGSKASWDLISRNTQAVVSGIYLYTVESKRRTPTGKIEVYRTQIGKIVVIK